MDLIVPQIDSNINIVGNVCQFSLKCIAGDLFGIKTHKLKTVILKGLNVIVEIGESFGSPESDLFYFLSIGSFGKTRKYSPNICFSRI